MAQTTSLKIYSFWRSSATFRVRVALNLKNVVAEEIFVDIDKGEQFDPKFLAVNPNGAIPALIDGDAAPITQSLAILEYLEEIYPEPPLLPRDAPGRARVRSLAAAMAADTHPLVVPRLKKYLMGTRGFDDAGWRAWQIHWFTRGLQAFEQRLSNSVATGTFCHGDSPTTADICLASVVAVARVFRIQVADIPTVDRIMATCDGHEAFVKADPKKQTGAPA